MKTKHCSTLIRSISPLIFLLIVFLSCDEEEPNVNFDEETVLMETLADADFDEIDDLVAIGVIAAEQQSVPGARINEDINDERFTCAMVTFNREARTLTIDFGDECEGPGGRTRRGIIRITYSGLWSEPGSVVTTTLEEFYLDGRKIEGTRTVTNVTDSQEGHPTYSITLAGGRITFQDGTVATREVSRTRRWIRTSNPLNDEIHILENSIASGLNRRGINYEVTIVEPLVYKRSCRRDLVFLPSSGLKEIESGDNIIVIDFGDGECDNIITVSYNGVIDTIEITSPSNPNS